MKGGYSVKAKVTIHGTESFFGPGIVVLLNLIEEKGSVKLACLEMGLSYTKAWTIINRAEKQLGFPLINRSQGGPKGGGASLTASGREVIDRYEELTARVQAFADEAFAGLFADITEKEVSGKESEDDGTEAGRRIDGGDVPAED